MISELTQKVLALCRIISRREHISRTISHSIRLVERVGKDHCLRGGGGWSGRGGGGGISGGDDSDGLGEGVLSLCVAEGV